MNTTLQAVLDDGQVAFEIDGPDRTADEAWSVVITGRAEEVHDYEALINVAVRLGMTPCRGQPTREAFIGSAQIRSPQSGHSRDILNADHHAVGVFNGA